MVKLTPTAMNELVEMLGQLMEDEKSRRPCLALALGNDAPSRNSYN